MTLRFRLIKYLLNMLGLIWMFNLSILSYALIVRFPLCEQVMAVILNTLSQSLPIFIFFYLIITTMNYFTERRLEKRIQSREFIYLLLADIFFVGLGFYYASMDFQQHCGQPS